jgi:hypothetical protein
MRRLRFAILLSACFTLSAAAQPLPPRLEPLPEPPPPPMPSGGGPDEPRVRIPVQDTDRVEEIRDGDRVLMIKVTPREGPPYYLVDTSGRGSWVRRDSLDQGLRVPMWPLFTFD